MKEYSLIMGLTDYIPVIFFSVAGGIFIKMLYQKSRLKDFAILTGGFMFAGFAGFCKATYKTLYGGGICDFPLLNDIHMFLLGVGIFMTGYALIGITSRKNEKINLYSASPVVITSNIPFVILNVFGCLNLCIGVIRFAKRLESKSSVFYIIGYLIIEIGVGAMGSIADFDKTMSNWIGQGCQTVATFLFLMCAVTLNKKMKISENNNAFWSQYK